MSKLDELIKELCPDGCVFIKIDDCFDKFNGMTGVSLKWKDEGNCKFIDYMNAYRNLKIDVTQTPFATVKNSNQNTLKHGDILVTTASEVPDECALTSVIENEIEDNIFLDDHLFGLHLKEAYKESIDTTFVNYYMNTINFKNDVRKKVKGVTRFFVAPNDIGKIFIPFPHIEIQREIVRILDNFTELTAELTAELTDRKKQYEYYKNVLFNNAKGIELLTLDVIAENCDSQRKPVTSGNRETGSIPYYGASGIVDYVNDYIFDGDYLLISEDGANLLARTTPIAFSTSGKTWVNNHAHVLKFDEYATRRYVEMYLNSIDLTPYITGAAQPKLNQKNLNNIKIPLPPLPEQQRLVDILDRFDTLCNNISTGLPAEIDERQKQYKYYRDKLLTFEKFAVEV